MLSNVSCPNTGILYEVTHGGWFLGRGASQQQRKWLNTCVIYAAFQTHGLAAFFPLTMRLLSSDCRDVNLCLEKAAVRSKQIHLLWNSHCTCEYVYHSCPGNHIIQDGLVPAFTTEKRTGWVWYLFKAGRGSFLACEMKELGQTALLAPIFCSFRFCFLGNACFQGFWRNWISTSFLDHFSF